jgi:hypothetical protein
MAFVKLKNGFLNNTLKWVLESIIFLEIDLNLVKLIFD